MRPMQTLRRWKRADWIDHAGACTAIAGISTDRQADELCRGLGSMLYASESQVLMVLQAIKVC
jgi:hypothetical protein